MSLVTKENINSDIIDVMKLTNDTYLKGRNAANSADVDILKVTSSDAIQFASVPSVLADPAADNELMRKTYLIDNGNKIRSTFLPSTVMEFKGAWDASTNTPTLADGVGDAGDVYRVNVAGDASGWMTDSGPKTFAVGDLIIYSSAAGKWQHAPASDSVVSVNSKTGAVVLNTDDISESGTPTNKYFTDTRAKTASVLNTLAGSQTDQSPSVSAVNTALAGKLARLGITTNQMVYVNSNYGNDTTGDGSSGNPYATTNKALSMITDAALSKAYAICFQAARQIETGDVLAKPYVFFVGVGQRATYFRINSGQLKPASGFQTGTGWTGFFNLYFGGASTINFDLQTYGAGGNGGLFIVDGCTLSGNCTFKGRNAGAGDFLEMYNTMNLGTLTLDSMLWQINTSGIGGNVSITNSVNFSGLSGTFISANFNGNVTLDATGGSFTYYASNTSFGTASNTLTTVGTLTMQIDSMCLPPLARRTISGGTTITYTNDCSSLKYVPTTSGDWPVQPTRVDNALDKLANRIAAFSGANPAQEKITITGTHLSDGYIDLAYPVLNSIAVVWPIGGLPQEPAVDYTLANTGAGGVGRLSLTGGGTLATILTAGAKLMVNYLRG